MSFWEKLSNLDRRIIFLLVFLVVLIPLVFPIGFPLKGAQPPVEALYQYIEKLEPGKVVLVSLTYDPSTIPELYPMHLASLRHCFKKNLRVLGVCLNPKGTGIGEMALQSVAKEFNKQEGIDYVYLGYKTGPVTFGMGEDIHATFPTDYKGTKITDLLMMKDIHTYKDIALIIDLTASSPAYIATAVTKYDATVALGVTAVMAADMYPYLQAKQIIALLGGLRGAAEYEILINKPDKGLVRMDSQSLAHILILVLIIVANISYFMIKRRKRD